MKIMLHAHPLTALEILKQIPDLRRWDDNQELDFLNDFVKKTHTRYFGKRFKFAKSYFISQMASK